MRTRILLVLAALGATSLAQEKADAVVEPSTKVPRGKLLEWKSAQGRPYWYRLPKEMDAKNPPALLIMLHGTGGNHGWSFWNYPIVGGDFRKRDIVVSPDGVTPGQGDTFNFVQGPKDGEQIAGLITDFKKRFPIGRVYLYGHSQGAFFCYWFAGEHPELIDGIVAHAGNVLQVKHDKLTKQKVAIAILHGREDDVVSVDCAIQTEKIYRDEGYTKLKLEIVDGLTKESGHWPLPGPVSKLLDWCDQVTTQSATQCVQTLASELQKKSPDLAVVAEQLKRGRALLGKAGADDKKELAPQLDAVQAFLDDAVAVHLQHVVLSFRPGETPPSGSAVIEAPYLYMNLERAFADHPVWKKDTTSLREQMKAQDKVVDKAKKALAKNSKESRTAALRALEASHLSSGFEELRTLLGQACANAKPPDDECKRHVEAHGNVSKKQRDEANKKIAELNAPLIADLKAKAPALFASSEADATK